jgi:hypothetical protein
VFSADPLSATSTAFFGIWGAFRLGPASDLTGALDGGFREAADPQKLLKANVRKLPNI